MQDPKYQQFISQSPNAQAFQSAMQAHMAEHMAFSYKREIELKVGVNLPKPEEMVPPQLQNDIAKISALGAAKLVQTHAQQMAAQEAQQQANDPLTVIQKQELEIKQKLADIKEMEAEVKALVEANKMILEYKKSGISERGEMIDSVTKALGLINQAETIMPNAAPVQPVPGQPAPQVPINGTNPQENPNPAQ